MNTPTVRYIGVDICNSCENTRKVAQLRAQLAQKA